MRLPETMHERRYGEWNYLVRGLMELWELARLFGLEEDMEALVESDPDGATAEHLGRLGNGLFFLAEMLSLQATLQAAGQRRAAVHAEAVFRDLGGSLDPGQEAGLPERWRAVAAATPAPGTCVY